MSAEELKLVKNHVSNNPYGQIIGGIENWDKMVQYWGKDGSITKEQFTSLYDNWLENIKYALDRDEAAIEKGMSPKWFPCH